MAQPPSIQISFPTHEPLSENTLSEGRVFLRLKGRPGGLNGLLGLNSLIGLSSRGEDCGREVRGVRLLRRRAFICPSHVIILKLFAKENGSQMKSQSAKVIGFIAVVALIPLACGLGIGGDGDALEGKWELTSDAALFGDEDALFAEEGEEFFDAKVFFTFGSSGDFLLEIPLFIDYEGIFSNSGFDASVEIVAEPLNMLISISGTYEQLSGDIIQLDLDPNSIAYSPAEYCFSLGGEEICQDLSEITQEFETSDFELGTGNYEIDGSTLTMWDDVCDYPADQTCAMIFTKVE